MNVTEAVASRRSIRQFLDKPVPLAVLRSVLDKARMAPSGCNYQPWEASVLTGEPLRALQAAMQAQGGPQDPPEYDWAAPAVSAPHQERLLTLGGTMYAALGVGREDVDARQAFMARNLVSFGAPVVLLCHFPRFVKEPQWSDVGMWLQTIMLLLREEGLDSCPQEFLSVYARVIKQHIGVSDADHLFFCGLAIGYRDADAPVNAFARDRVPLDQHVRFAGF